ncbi:glycosyltransferase family 4 protein [bacterium]|nr:glycosyltransferase family 4 protein [bacterium]
MRIAQVAPLWIPVPPYTYGGTELIVSWLTEELVKRGHQVTLFASGDSKTSARLVPIWHNSLWRAHLHTPHAVYSLLYKKILEMQDEFDIIHDHCEFYTTHLSTLLKPPIVSTIHHPIYEEMIVLFKKFPKINYVTISKSQKKSAPGINAVKTIYHGLPIEKYEFNPKPKDYLLWLSKIAPEKGPAEAIEIAKAAGEKLIISGPILPGYGDYFDYRIKPLIDGKQIQFVGVADFQKKVELFKNAKAFIYPIKRQEPFGLVVTEAMVCGTPVIAYNRGSMPELIKDKKTGFLVSSKEEAIEAVKNIDQIKRIDCRRHVVRKFNLKKMVNKYEALYYKILKNQKNEKK